MFFKSLWQFGCWPRTPGRGGRVRWGDTERGSKSCAAPPTELRAVERSQRSSPSISWRRRWRPRSRATAEVVPLRSTVSVFILISLRFCEWGGRDACRIPLRWSLTDCTSSLVGLPAGAISESSRRTVFHALALWLWSAPANAEKSPCSGTLPSLSSLNRCSWTPIGFCAS